MATRVGGTPEVIRDRENGYLVDPNNPAELGEAIACALVDKDLTQRTRDYNHRLRTTSLDPDKIVSRLLDLYRAG